MSNSTFLTRPRREARRISNEFTVWVKDAGLVEAGVYFFLSCLSFEHHISDVEFRP